METSTARLRYDLSGIGRSQVITGPPCADDSPAQVRKKKEAFEAIRSNRRMQRDEQAADLWTAAFFADLTEDNLRQRRIPDTEAIRNTIDCHDAGLGVCTARDLHERLRFFHWPLEFPEVFSRGGFDVVLSNPPWELLELEEQEFFATRVPKIAQAPNAAARKALIEKLRDTDPSTWLEYSRAMHDTDALRKFLRSSNRYPLTSSGRNNSYSIFAELFTELVRPDGRVGAVLPTGIATDDTKKAFFGSLATSGRLASLFDFENREGLFPAVDSRQKFCLITMRGARAAASGPADFAFFLTRAAQLRDQARTFPLRPEDFARINPNTRTCPIFRTRADADLTRRIYERVPVLINEASGENPWNISFRQGLFNMSSDSGLFRTRQQLESDRFELLGNRFLKGRKVYLPLYEAKMIHQFDHRFGSFEGIETRTNTSLPTPDQASYGRADNMVLPWYWVAEAEVETSLDGWNRQWMVGFRRISNATNERSFLVSILPRNAAGDSVFFVAPKYSAVGVASLVGCLNSLTLDYTVRQKVAGLNMNFFYVQQFPVLPPSAYSPTDLLFIVPRVLELTATAWDIQPFADDVWRDADHELRAAIKLQWQENRKTTGGQPAKPPEWYSPAESGFPYPPFRWSEVRRGQLRAELDAWYARLYGLDERDLRYILDPEDVYGPDFPGETFRVLKNNEKEHYGEYPRSASSSKLGPASSLAGQD
jgi:hypothetical protein